MLTMRNTCVKMYTDRGRYPKGERKMKTTTNIEQFTGYNKTLAQCHMDNWGIIFIDDEYNEPMEIEDVISQGFAE